MTPRTLEQIRAALPTHIMLTPGCRVRLGDETVDAHGLKWELCAGWTKHALITTEIVRRQIPSRILDNQAFYLFAAQFGVRSIDEVLDRLGSGVVQKHIGEGRLYDKWLLEQIGDV